ncbi:MAG: hypothetical protein ABIB47_06250 [Candidatus Woesearchaeota archaeon]
MQSGKIAKKAIEIIERNPEYFEALVEFEKTGKLPKLKYKKRANFTIDADLLKKFRDFCRENGMKMSTRLEYLIKKDVF